jgi:hypothetical protein
MLAFKKGAEAMTMRLPGFLLYSPSSRDARPYQNVLSHDPDNVITIVPARIVCGTPALGATCTALQFPEWMFPCFGNETCGLFFAGVKLPACYSCRVV